MTQLGSSRDIISQSITGVTDDLGNSVVSTSTGFGASPLGVSARAQALYGIANPNFNLTPPAPNSPIEDQSNPLPFWSIDNGSNDQISATSVFDATTQTFGIELNPGTAAIDSTLTLTTRSYLITDDNLSLRQKALSVLSKSGTAGGTASQWNLTLTAIYYDATATALSTAVIGTALDTGTWTSISGTTTPGGSAINPAAQYVDLSFKMTTTAAVTGSAKATLKSLLLQTSTFGSQSFLITETFTAGTTWAVPTGITQIQALVAVGGGGGGGGGGLYVNASAGAVGGGAGGGGGQAVWVNNLSLGTATSVSIGIGAGGSGGTAGSGNWTEPYSGTVLISGGAGGAGGATTFGTFITALGGGGGGGGSASIGSAASGSAIAGTAAGSASIYFPATISSGALGGSGSGNVNNSFATGAGTAFQGSAGISGYQAFALVETAVFPGTAIAGANGTVTGSAPAYSSYTGGGAAGTVGYSGGGGGGGGASGQQNGITFSARSGANAGAGGGGGGGGGAVVGLLANTGTATFTGGSGGNAGIYSAGGGGGGGGLAVIEDNGSTPYSGTAVAGAGGNGASGFVVIAYIG